MTETPDAHGFQARLQRLEGLIRQVERSHDPTARAQTQAIVQAVLDLHGVALGRLLGHVADAGEAGRAILGACAADGVVAGLLLLHGLHPVDLEDRVRKALDRVRPQLRTHGSGVELLGAEDGIVRLRLLGNDDGRQAVEEAVIAAAPDAAVMIEGETAGVNGHSRMALPVV